VVEFGLERPWVPTPDPVLALVMTLHTRLIRTHDSVELYAQTLAWHGPKRTQKQWAGPLGSKGRRQGSDAWMMR
jgi:hypothetical protein